MTSFITHKKQTNTLYVNTCPIQSSILQTNLSTVSWANLETLPYLSTAGAVLLRDMGKTIYIPDSKDPSSSENIILRKVQLVTDFNTKSIVYGENVDYYTGYIRIGSDEFMRAT